jgi:hypothetical protein
MGRRLPKAAEASRHIGAYTHPAPSSPQEPDTERGNYYVSVRHYDGRHALLLGPFPNNHAAALAAVGAARAKACDVDPRAHWYAFGTCRLASEFTTPGVLNDLLPELVR